MPPIPAKSRLRQPRLQSLPRIGSGSEKSRNEIGKKLDLKFRVAIIVSSTTVNNAYRTTLGKTPRERIIGLALNPPLRLVLPCLP